MTTFNELEHQRRSAAWNKATIIPKFDQSVWRWDPFGTPIRWLDHGNRDSEHGWEIDHIVPLSKGGGDDLNNLQALHWRNNVKNSDRVF